MIAVLVNWNETLILNYGTRIQTILTAETGECSMQTILILAASSFYNITCDNWSSVSLALKDYNLIS